ncbi:YceI family protein [Legionella cardiaca]|uniref:YceI family protein n=1 Tax=Legionella cardiaca TaxID=1071983 RepID=A0ABY8ASR4_9GAMM|nr:YceI family protein [Legionella cardiaca]WED43583.1 YceI family protein [Legionella cardiaca]
MIRSLKNALLLCSLLLPASFPLFAAETLTLDNEHSYVLWHVKHLGFSTQSGKWYVNGTLILDKDKPENSQVKATVNVADLITGIPELDKHLKAKLFFDAARFPTATFVSNKVDVLSKNSAKVHGTLTLRGVSKPVTLDVVFNKAGKNPVNERMTAGFSATTTIKRSDFGLNAFLPNVGDEVKIEIEAEAYKADDAAKTKPEDNNAAKK